MLVVLLLGLLFLRDPQAQEGDEHYLRWLLQHSRLVAPAVPLTIVEIGTDVLGDTPAPMDTKGGASFARSVAIAPLEFALFLQAIMEFHPQVIAFENILKWRERDRAQEQVFLDQAMRVPKLLLAAELTAAPDPDAPPLEMQAFTDVKGRRGNLAEFSGIGRQPSEEMRLISTLSFVNLPDDVSSDVRVPLLFMYRGEVIPSFTMQAILLWLRITPAEVKVEIGSHIALPDGRKVPIDSRGSMLIHPNAAQTAQRISLNELLLATQQREGGGSPVLSDLQNSIVLARTPSNPLSPPEGIAAAIAAIQGNAYIRRVSRWFDALVLAAAVGCMGIARRLDAGDIVLCGIAFSAIYCLAALALISSWHIWLPGLLPLGGTWFVIIVSMITRAKPEPARGTTIAIPPPVA